MGSVSVFGSVVDHYDTARPSYPPALYAALGSLRGRYVLDAGTGTGIAARELCARGARVIAVDLSREMLARARVREPTLAAVEADGAALPLLRASVDVACFAQSWHWMPEGHRVHEVARVLRSGGVWAAWWSHARADGTEWFERQWQIFEGTCPGVHRSQRDTEWGRELAPSGLFAPAHAVTVLWTRRVDLVMWLTELRSHSHLAVLDSARREAVLSEVADAMRVDFATGAVDVPYSTALWTAVRL
jgi:SAM-dependent methyltransferase